MFKAITLLLLAFAAPLSAAQAGEADILNTLQQRLPQLGTIKQVNKSAVPGLFEVVTEDHLFYTDEQAQFLIDGAIYDLKNMRNITEERARKLYAINFDSLPLNVAVKKVKGKGTRRLAIFTDPNCGFCKRLEHELLKLDNVTLYLFMYPIFPGSEEKVRAVWCSKNQVKAWDDLMQNDILPPAGKCNFPKDKIMALGRQLKVNGTPALVFSDGTINPGYMPAAELEKVISDAASH